MSKSRIIENEYNKEMLINLRNAIEKKMDELGDDFWNNEEIPSFTYDYMSIINPFYSEDFMLEVENPFEYYGMKNEDMKKFFDYYL